MEILDPSREGKIGVAPHVFVGLYPSAKQRVSKQYHAMYGKTFKRILETCCELFSVSVQDAVSKSRMHEIVCARRACIAICRLHIGTSYTKIGKLLGRDHATMIHNVKMHYDWMETYQEYATTYEQIETRLKLDRKYEQSNVG